MRCLNCGGESDSAGPCTPCREYRAAVQAVKRSDPERYHAWVSCSCGAFDRALVLTRPHLADCRVNR